MTNDLAYDAVEKAKRQRTSGNPTGAVKTLEEYLATDPHAIRPRLELANIYIYDLQNRDVGIMQLEVLQELAPDDTDVLKAVTTVKMTHKKYNMDVDRDYRHLAELVVLHKDPAEYAGVCAAYAVFLRKQILDFPRAGEYYEKATAACPDRYEYHQDYAVLLLNDLKDYAKAKHELEEVLRLRPDSISARKNYDLLLRDKFDKNGQPKKSLLSRLRGR